MLLELEANQLENKIAKLRGSVDAAEQELAEQQRIEELLECQYVSAKAKAEAELTQVTTRLRNERDEQAALAGKAKEKS